MADQDRARLDAIATEWTLLKRAQGEGGTDASAQAQAELLERYQGAVGRYLLGSLKDVEAAKDLFQDFACRFLRGDFRGADPQKGRFRDYLKGVVSHMVADYCKRKQRQPRELPEKFPEPQAPAPQLDALFQQSWRDELLKQSWDALEEMERTTGQPFHTVLRYRADHPDLRSPDLADGLSQKLNKPISAVGVRQLLHRARGKFAELLRDKVRATLPGNDPDDLEAELQELGLSAYLKT